MALTPRSRSLTAGQLLLARALAFDALGEGVDPSNEAQLRELQRMPVPLPPSDGKARTEHVDLEQDASRPAAGEPEQDSPRTVSDPPISPPLAPAPDLPTASPIKLPLQATTPLPPAVNTAPSFVPPPPCPPASSPRARAESEVVMVPEKAPAELTPSPRSIRKMSKDELQALINARAKARAVHRPVVITTTSAACAPPPPPAVNRFTTKYRTPTGQEIKFMDQAINSPPTPRFGAGPGHKAVDVLWKRYDCVHKGTDEQASPPAGGNWPVEPFIDDERRQVELWESKLLSPYAASAAAIST